MLLPPFQSMFQIIGCFDFSRFIDIIMHLDIYSIWMHNNIYELKKVKMTYNLEWREYKNLEAPRKGPGKSFAVLEHEYLPQLAAKVDIDLGVDTHRITQNINALKNNEITRCVNFEN